MDAAHRLPRAGPKVRSSWFELVAALSAVVLVGVLLHIAAPERIPAVANFTLIFSSILIEAVPFVLIGATLSAAIEVFVPASWFARLARLPVPLQLPAAALAGLAFPVCECGSVPVARRLTQRGLPAGPAVTFMLAAPILNPVVLASTIVAYRGRSILWPMVLARGGLGLVIAVAVGWLMAGERAEGLLRDAPDPACSASVEPAWSRFFAHLNADFSFMVRFLILGAGVAAALQTLVPQRMLDSVAGRPVLDLVAMMALAFLLSLCSESDAFVAASFVQFGPGAQLAFLVFGPMLDTKLGSLYAGTFSTRFVRDVLLVVFLLTLVGALWFQVALG
jgi:uncharacterized membrane protein YraQ (UPF0718 family)